MNHHIPSVLAATMLACAATALRADTATAQQRHEPGGFTSTTTLPGPCFIGGLWNEKVAGPPPISFRQLATTEGH